MNIKEIKEILGLMQEHELAEIELEKDGLKLKIRKNVPGRLMPEYAAAGQAAAHPVAHGIELTAQSSALASSAAEKDVVLIRSPMVGTFYSAPAPDQPPYVTSGKRIAEGDVLCIIEAMKLMNEIKSEAAGTVVEVLVQNGQPVEFDQPLFKVKKG
jgi:acetyl-CoA carboxylase biotin carboxyl carrier protein